MKEEIDNLSFDQIEDYGASQKDAIWGHAPAADPNVLTVEEIMGKAKEHKAVEKEERSQAVTDDSPTKEIELDHYEDVSSTDLSDAAQMVIEKMRAVESGKKEPQPETHTPNAFKVHIDDDLFADSQDDIYAPKNIMGEQPEPVIEHDEPAQEDADMTVATPEHAAEDEFELDIDLNQTIGDYEDVSSEKEPVEQEQSEDEPLDNQATNIFNTPISTEVNYDDEEDEEAEQDGPQERIDSPEQLYQAFIFKRRNLRITGAFTFIIALLFFSIAVIKPWPLTDALYYYVTGALMAVAMAVNYKIMGALSTLFKKVPNSDCSCALASIFALLQIVVCSVFKDSLDKEFGYFSMFGLAACVSMLFSTIGKLSITKRIIANIKMLEENQVHNAAVFIAPPYSGQLVDIQEIGETLICARRQADDLKGFLHYSLALDPYETIYSRTLIISVILSWISGLVYGLIKGDIVAGLTLATAVFTLFAPFSILVVNGIGISSICKRLRTKGTMLSGYSAAEEISNANVIELEACELFDGSSVNLYNFKTFDQYPFPQAIADAAAITQAVNSPLAGMFAKIVASNKTVLPEVDHVEYEEKMGVTGWLNEKKTIIGNRMIMESHNVPVPPLDFDKKIIQSGKFPVYLANDGQLTAVFIVGYSVKKQMVMRIRKLANTGVTMLVRTTDPNVTNELICSKYGISSDSVIIMTSSAANYYQEITEKTDVEPAMLVSRNARGFIDAYILSINAKQTASLASILIFIGCIVVSVLCILLSFLNYANLVTSITVCLIHTLGLAFIAFINMLRS